MSAKPPVWQNRITGSGVKPASQFLAHPLNWRQHPPMQREALATSLSRVGWVQQVIENTTTGHLLDGHERVWQALQADDADVPFIQVELTEDEERFVLATLDPISALAEIDGETLKLLAGEDIDLSQFFDADELAAILADAADEPPEDPGPQIDKAAELQTKWNVQPGDLFAIGAHRLLCGDSTRREDVERVMGDARAEMVWTDPPYGVGVGDKNKMLNAIAPSNRVEDNLEGDTLSEPELVQMLEQSFDNSIAYCTAGAAWYVAAPPVPLHVLFGLVLKARGIWRQTLQWVKNNSTFSPMGVCYHWQAEPIFFGWLPNGPHRFYGGRTQTTVWTIDRPLASPEHPTMKPVELVARAIENSSRRGEVVVDFFAGSGTTLAACEQLHRQGRSIEIEPRYCSVILERLSQMGLRPERVP